MPSERAYVWVWLDDATEPVVAGALDRVGDRVDFVYGASYLSRPDAVALYLPELPLRRGSIPPTIGLTIAGCIADAGPDAWGQRVILHKLLGGGGRAADPGDIDTLTYLLESGSDRVGALDFQPDATEYRPRTSPATLEDLIHAADRLQAGESFSPELDAALLHGSSIGGARPKALLLDGDRSLIAKFSSSTDTYPVVKAEGVAMELARRVGLDVASSEVVRSAGRDVLLVERFDRPGGGRRRMMVSALTMLGLHEMIARYATYPDLADLIRHRFVEPAATLRELFARIVFNICVGNTDDHARNHAAFWDGARLRLTPAYDLCPQPRSGNDTAQAMAIGRDGYRLSRLAGCVASAEAYLLSAEAAQEIVDHQVETIRSAWSGAADAARLLVSERTLLWGRQLLNPSIFYGAES